MVVFFIFYTFYLRGVWGFGGVGVRELEWRNWKYGWDLVVGVIFIFLGMGGFEE